MTTKPQRRIEYVALDELVPAEKNPKGHDDAVIGSSIDRFGFIEPGILDERTGRLVAGHGRREQLIAKRDAGEQPPEGVRVTAGVWHVPVVRGWSSADDAEALAAGIALNRATEKGGWTDELPALLAEVAEHSTLDGLGFDRAELDAMIEALRVPDFGPTGREDQPRLDTRDPITCPHCGGQFIPAVFGIDAVVIPRDE